MDKWYDDRIFRTYIQVVSSYYTDHQFWIAKKTEFCLVCNWQVVLVGIKIKDGQIGIDIPNERIYLLCRVARSLSIFIFLFVLWCNVCVSWRNRRTISGCSQKRWENMNTWKMWILWKFMIIAEVTLKTPSSPWLWKNEIYFYNDEIKNGCIVKFELV